MVTWRSIASIDADLGAYAGGLGRPARHRSSGLRDCVARVTLPFNVLRFKLLGVQACISTWQQTGYLFSQGGTIAGQSQRSDTQAIADLLLLPYWFWGAAISALILAMLWWSFKRAFSR